MWTRGESVCPDYNTLISYYLDATRLPIITFIYVHIKPLSVYAFN